VRDWTLGEVYADWQQYESEFLDSHNDHIWIFARPKPGSDKMIEISDGGEYRLDAEIFGKNGDPKTFLVPGVRLEVEGFVLEDEFLAVGLNRMKDFIQTICVKEEGE